MSVQTNGWREDILVEKIQDMMGAASASIYPINLLKVVVFLPKSNARF